MNKVVDCFISCLAFYYNSLVTHGNIHVKIRINVKERTWINTNFGGIGDKIQRG